MLWRLYDAAQFIPLLGRVNMEIFVTAMKFIATNIAPISISKIAEITPTGNNNPTVLNRLMLVFSERILNER